MPLVSIIIPVYNVEAYIENSLRSALSQTYADIEYIIVDDCGTDKSIDIVNSIKQTHPEKNIKILKHEKNYGQSIARNNGVKNATGEYIFFMDSDDGISCNCIELHMSYMMKYDVDFTQGGLSVIGNRFPFKDICRTTYIQYKDNIIESFFDNRLYPSPCNKLIKRDFIVDNNIYFTEGFIYEDVEWVFKMARVAKAVVMFPDKTYQYIIRNNSTITSTITLKHIQSKLYSQNFFVDYIDNCHNEIELCRAVSWFSEQQFKYLSMIVCTRLNITTKKEYYNILNAPKYRKHMKGLYSLFTALPFEIFLVLIYIPRRLYSRIVHSTLFNKKC